MDVVTYPYSDQRYSMLVKGYLASGEWQRTFNLTWILCSRSYLFTIKPIQDPKILAAFGDDKVGIIDTLGFQRALLHDLFLNNGQRFVLW